MIGPSPATVSAFRQLERELSLGHLGCQRIPIDSYDLTLATEGIDDGKFCFDL